MISTQKIPLVIPSYEPDERLEQLCDDLVKAGISDIIVVDDGSGPSYRHIFDRLEETYHVTILRHAVNLGKGRGLKTAFNYLLNRDENLLGCVTADSDGQHTPQDILKVMDALEADPGHLILGCRDFDQDNVPWKSKMGNKITCRVTKWIAGVGVSDTQTGLRAIPAQFMRELLAVDGERFEFEMNMLVKTKDAYPIKEVVIETVYDSKENHSTHFHPVRDSIRIYRIFGRMFAKFLLSSLSSSVIDLLLFHLFCTVLKPLSALWYVAAATLLARVISATYNYFVNYVLVFESKESHGRSMSRYFFLAVVQMSLSALFVTLGTRLLPGRLEVGIKVVVDVVLFFISYVIQREFVFSSRN